MAINTLEYSKIFQTELDQQMIDESTTGWMEENAKYDDFDKNFIMSTNDVVSRFMEPMRYLKKEYFNCSH